MSSCCRSIGCLGSNMNTHTLLITLNSRAVPQRAQARCKCVSDMTPATPRPSKACHMHHHHQSIWDRNRNRSYSASALPVEAAVTAAMETAPMLPPLQLQHKAKKQPSSVWSQTRQASQPPPASRDMPPALKTHTADTLSVSAAAAAEHRTPDHGDTMRIDLSSCSSESKTGESAFNMRLAQP
jgi:hypothetical protein